MALLLAVGYCHFKAFSKTPDTLSIRRLKLLGLVACIGEKHRNGLVLSSGRFGGEQRGVSEVFMATEHSLAERP